MTQPGTVAKDRDEPATYVGEKTIGRLTAVAGEAGYSEVYVYDTYGRPKADRMVAAGDTYDVGYTYGMMKAVKDFNSPSIVYWQAVQSNRHAYWPRV